MTLSKPWNWALSENPAWLDPSDEGRAIAERWKNHGVESVLDFGCGLGRHAIFFAQRGFRVSAFDLSQDAVDHLNAWAKRENLPIKTETADMLNLPYSDNAFDAIFAFHTVFHTDSVGIRKIINEIKRVLKPKGQLYLTLGSKETWAFRDAGVPKIDANTIVKIEDGPENGIPHVFVDFDDIPRLFAGFSLINVRHVDHCLFNGKPRNSKHYFIEASLN